MARNPWNDNPWNQASSADEAVDPARKRGNGGGGNNNRGGGGGGGGGNRGPSANDAGITSGGTTAGFNRDPLSFLNAVAANNGYAAAAKDGNPFQAWLSNRFGNLLNQWTNSVSAQSPNKEFVNWFNTAYASPLAEPAGKKKDPNDKYREDAGAYEQYLRDAINAYYGSSPFEQGNDIQSFGGGPTRWAAF